MVYHLYQLLIDDSVMQQNHPEIMTREDAQSSSDGARNPLLLIPKGASTYRSQKYERSLSIVFYRVERYT